MQQPGRPPDRPILGVATKPLTDRLDVVRPTLLVFDSIKSFLPADMSLSDGPGVRAVLEWLQVIARSRRITILITLHLRKQKAEDELDTVSHSAEWTNVPRQVLMMGRDPRQRGRYILSVAKQAEGVATPPVYYRIKERVGWGYWDPMGEAPVSSADLAGEDEGPMERSRRDLARDYLRKVLTDEDMPSSQLREDCEQTGISCAHALARRRRPGRYTAIRHRGRSPAILLVRAGRVAGVSGQSAAGGVWAYSWHS